MSEKLKNGLYIHSSGDKVWYKNGVLHREDGPAIEFPDGGKQWRIDGNLHREDGPAIEGTGGYKAWYLHDVELTEEEVMTKYNANQEKKHLEQSLGEVKKVNKIKL